ncbi:peptidoglycan-binding protein [Pseudorhodobacter turbinis]|uniref:Peptidoglycan-binding protein n=1 Tax=Pseudorhodobacter turbinis TaxID=2500533 RepID=A0A4V1E0M3_9RHOB|nr:peptidoglycan-binding domain-containing protein [Pseudorhodobacter turbinis]QCO55134.1 peptidoglycan-binding protein [Pseudorhodobacter turbinis]
MQPTATFAFLALVLMGCQPVQAPVRAHDLTAELFPKTNTTPPSKGANICWADDVTPAIIETVTEQIQVRPQTLDAEGNLAQTAVFETKTAQHIVQDRREVWFRIPCQEEMTVDFLSSLQRAFKARGYYKGGLTGQLDAQTRRAIRLYQEPLGLGSDKLSLAAARRLGIAAGEFEW